MFRLELNTGSLAVRETVLVAGAPVTVDVPAGPFVRVTVIGGMLGVGTFHLFDPLALSVGGMAGAAIFAALMTFIYRWGLRTLI